MPKVSVIVPVYNVEDYIIQCLESIRNQSFQDFEVIIVNDGTKDRSAEYVSEYIQCNKLENFVLINKENGGVSSARNVGIENAAGEWIAFIDSDDYVEEQYLAKMIEGLDAYPAEFCMSGLKRYFERTKEVRLSLMPDFCYGTLAEVLDKLFYITPCARLYSSRIINEHCIRFDERISGSEDRAFNHDFFSYAKKYVVVADSSYVYRMRAGSATSGIVLPEKKRHVYEHAKRFWMSFEDENIILEAFKRSHHLAHNILDSFLADVINAVLDNDRALFRELVDDRISRIIIENYKHKSAPRKEKLLVGLLRCSQYLLCKVVIKLYYNNRLHKLLKPIVKLLR